MLSGRRGRRTTRERARRPPPARVLAIQPLVRASARSFKTLAAATWSLMKTHRGGTEYDNRAGRRVPSLRRRGGGHARAQQHHADGRRRQRRRAPRTALPPRRRHRDGAHDVPRAARARQPRARHPRVLTTLHWGGAAFLLWLAWKIATSSGMEAAAGAEAGRLSRGHGLSVGQPEVVARGRECGGDVSSAREAGAPIVQSAWLGGLFVLAALPSGFVWLAFGATVQRMLSRPPAEDLQHRHGRAPGLSVVLIVRSGARRLHEALAGAASPRASGMTPPGSPARIQSISRR